MKITFDKELTGIPEYELMPGDIVEVLEGDNGLEGKIVIVSEGSGVRRHFTDLETGYVHRVPSDCRCRLLTAELIVKAYEGKDRREPTEKKPKRKRKPKKVCTMNFQGTWCNDCPQFFNCDILCGKADRQIIYEEEIDDEEEWAEALEEIEEIVNV